MHLIIFQIMVFFLLTGFQPGYANSMINNSAQASVSGHITQTAKQNSQNIIHIGSIIQNSARNINVSAHVDGNIIVKTAKRTSTKLSIGSYGGK